MPLVPMKQVLDEAERGGYGVGAFNVNNMEQIQAIMRAAKEAESPVIVQASRGALRYTNLVYLRQMMLAAVEDNPEIKIVLHLDHGNDLEVVEQAIGLGFTSVMIDGSLEPDGKTPRSFESNVDITRRAVEIAHPHGVTVEGELGTLGGIEEHVQASRGHPHRPGRGSGVREADRRRCPGGGHRHIPRGLQVQGHADAGHRARGEDPRPAPRRAPGDARLFQRAPGADRRDQPVRRARCPTPWASRWRPSRTASARASARSTWTPTPAWRRRRRSARSSARSPSVFDPREYLGPARDAIYERGQGPHGGLRLGRPQRRLRPDHPGGHQARLGLHRPRRLGRRAARQRGARVRPPASERSASCAMRRRSGLPAADLAAARRRPAGRLPRGRTASGRTRRR